MKTEYTNIFKNITIQQVLEMMLKQMTYVDVVELSNLHTKYCGKFSTFLDKNTVRVHNSIIQYRAIKKS